MPLFFIYYLWRNFSIDGIRLPGIGGPHLIAVAEVPPFAGVIDKTGFLHSVKKDLPIPALFLRDVKAVCHSLRVVLQSHDFSPSDKQSLQ